MPLLYPGHFNTRIVTVFLKGAINKGYYCVPDQERRLRQWFSQRFRVSFQTHHLNVLSVFISGNTQAKITHL